MGPSNASYLPLGVETPIITFENIATAAQTIAPPTFNDTVGSTSMHFFTMSASFTMTATPLIAPPLHFDPKLAPTITLVNTSTSHTMTLVHDFLSNSHLLLEGSMIAVGPNETIKFVALSNGKWQQVGGIGHNYQSTAGAQGRGSNIISTSDATPTILYRISVGFLPPGMLRLDIAALDQGTGDNAFWQNLIVGTNDAGTILADNFPGGILVGAHPPVIIGSGGGGITPPFGWTNSVTVGGGELQVKFIGAVGHTVLCRVNVDLCSAPSSF
jgi:hypothetical protein